MYNLVQVTPNPRASYELQKDGACVGFFVWQEWQKPRRRGFQYIPNSINCGESRRLEPKLRSAMTMLGRLKSPVVNALVKDMTDEQLNPLQATLRLKRHYVVMLNIDGEQPEVPKYGIGCIYLAPGAAPDSPYLQENYHIEEVNDKFGKWMMFTYRDEHRGDDITVLEDALDLFLETESDCRLDLADRSALPDKPEPWCPAGRLDETPDSENELIIWYTEFVKYHFGTNSSSADELFAELQASDTNHPLLKVLSLFGEKWHRAVA